MCMSPVTLVGFIGSPSRLNVAENILAVVSVSPDD